MRLRCAVAASIVGMLGAGGAARAMDLGAFCARSAGQPLGVKQGHPVPITCDTVHSMAEWFPVPALAQGYLQALQALSRAKFATFYDKDPSLRLVCKPDLQGYLCELPLGPAQLLVGGDGFVRGISKTISKDGPDYAAVMAKAAGELGVDTISDAAMTLAMDIEAAAMKQGAGDKVTVTRSDRAYVYLFRL